MGEGDMCGRVLFGGGGRRGGVVLAGLQVGHVSGDRASTLRRDL